MRSFPNIEKSAFRAREYVGYGRGQVYRVRKDGCGQWEAIPRDGKGAWLRARTLAAIAATLSAEA